MNQRWCVEQMIKPGQHVVVHSSSPSGKYAAFFEDDGEVGYFYALSASANERKVLDAVQVYVVQEIRRQPIVLRIVWSTDGRKCALALDGRFHALFDFASRTGKCRSGFPPPHDEWAADGREWDDELLNGLGPVEGASDAM